jgi:Protein of unknown function (DUF3325)
MLLSISLAWLGIGLLLLANPQRARQLLGLQPGALLRWLARLTGTGLLVLSAWPLAPAPGGALTLVTFLLVAMGVASSAVLLMPLRPRLYLLSLPISAACAILSLALT